MGAPWKIWVQNQAYYRFGTYSTHEQAVRIARMNTQKPTKNTKRVRSYILKHEKGTLIPYTTYTVYLTNTINATR